MKVSNKSIMGTGDSRNVGASAQGIRRRIRSRARVTNTAVVPRPRYFLVASVYSLTRTFPKEETYSLVDQLRRAAASVGANLLEGAMRLGSKEYRQFVGIARGSAGEVCYHLLLAKNLDYISAATYQELRSGYDRVIQMLSRLSHALDR
jgi:four helix bundle protein